MHGTTNILEKRHVTFWLLFAAISLSLISSCQKSESPIENPSALADDRLKIEVEKDGLYRLTLSELQNAGLAINALNATKLQLSVAGTAVPYYLADDSLIFYGQAPTSRYTAVQPYILELGKEGRVMAETSINWEESAPALPEIPQSIHLEENFVYFPQARQAENSDVWFWETVSQGKIFSFSFELATKSEQVAALRLQLRGVTHNPDIELDHDFDLLLNGQYLDTIRWDGAVDFTSQIEIPPDILKIGANEITIDNEAEGMSFLDIFQINWVEVDYVAPTTAVNDQLQFREVTGLVNLTGFSAQPLLFDISEANDPRILVDSPVETDQTTLSLTSKMSISAIGPRGFLSPKHISPMRLSDWNNSQNQADLIIITTDELAPALSDLIDARTAQGLAVSLVPVAEIYDEFGDGSASPQSIQTFITYAFDRWQAPKPQFLLIVGDATTDYHNNLGNAPSNHIPSLLVPVQYSGETVSDSRLADVNGDLKPELAIGRWPVNTAQEVKSLVARTLAYEKGTAVNRTLFAADGTEPGFEKAANQLLIDSGLPEENAILLQGKQADEVTIAWNQGVWLTTYIGHGSVERWGKDDIFYPEAVAGLDAPTPPIVVQLTCLTGLFAHPDLTSLSETMILHEKGPVLLIAATSLTLSANQEIFALILLRELQNDENSRIGDAFQQAKIELPIDNEGLREISDTFVLLGDPSTLILRP